MIFWILRRFRRLGREAICIAVGHRISTRRRGPLSRDGMEIWCQRDCGFWERAR